MNGNAHQRENPDTKQNELFSSLRSSLLLELSDVGGTQDSCTVDFCPRCNSHHISKRGFDSRGRQRYMCAACNRSFTQSTTNQLSKTKLSVHTWIMFLECHVMDMSLRKTARKCNISLKTAFYMRLRLLGFIQKKLANCTLLKQCTPLKTSAHENRIGLNSSPTNPALIITRLAKKSFDVFRAAYPDSEIAITRSRCSNMNNLPGYSKLPFRPAISINNKNLHLYWAWHVWRFAATVLHLAKRYLCIVHESAIQIHDDFSDFEAAFAKRALIYHQAVYAP